MPASKQTKIAAAKSDAGRKAVAKQILALRKKGVAWDGDGGIVAQGFVNGAPQGRALLRKYGLAETGNGIARSYDRDAYGLRGPRTTAPKGRKTGKATPKAKAKATPKATPRKRAPKA